LSLLVVADYTRDEGYKETRFLSGLSIASDDGVGQTPFIPFSD